MAISLMDGLAINASQPVDTRLLLTKAEMLAVKGSKMPDKYICICKDDGKLYIYDKSITTLDPQIGKFKAYEDVIDLPKAITDAMGTEAGKASMEAAVAKTLPGSMKATLEDPTLGPQLVNNMFDSEHFELTLDNKIDLSISVIQAIDSN